MRKIIRKIMAACLLLSCTNRDKPVDKADLTGSDYRLFQGTPAWELAKAVEDGDEKKINEIVAKDPSLINYRDPKFGSTLLTLTVMNQQMKSFRILLADKADVTIHDTYSGTSPLIEACSYPTYDRKYAEMLLEHGANVNDVETGPRKEGNSTRYTPLMAASKEGNLQLVELLVEKGANMNYQNEYKQSALSEAVIQDKYDVVLFLLKRGADYTLSITYNEEQKKTYYLADELRFSMPDIGSGDHKLKMQIVDFLKGKGIDYRAIPVPEYVKKKAQEEYPNSWQEYLEKY